MSASKRRMIIIGEIYREIDKKEETAERPQCLSATFSLDTQQMGQKYDRNVIKTIWSKDPTPTHQYDCDVVKLGIEKRR